MQHWFYPFGQNHLFGREFLSARAGAHLPAKIGGGEKPPVVSPEPGDVIIFWLQGAEGGLAGWGSVLPNRQVYSHTFPDGEIDWRLDVRVDFIPEAIVPAADVSALVKKMDGKALPTRGTFVRARHAIVNAARDMLPNSGLPPYDEEAEVNREQGRKQQAAKEQAINENIAKKKQTKGAPKRKGPRNSKVEEESAPPPAEEVAKASLTAIAREASDEESGLEVDSYAVSLTSLLRSATGEVCMALFGHWGLGKTYLAKRLEKLLRDPELYGESLEKLGLTEDGANHSTTGDYGVMWYSAWRYRRIPEQWIYLYETLAKHMKQGAGNTPVGPLLKFARILRFGIAKHGLLGLIALLAMLWLAVMPLSSKFNLFGIATNYFGVAGLVFLLGAAQRSSATVTHLLAKYGKLPSHRDGLGLQALIGDDVKALMAAWLPDDTEFSANRGWVIAGLVGLLGAVALWLLLLGQQEAGLPADIAAVPIAHAAALIAWGIVSLACVWLAFGYKKAPEKLLLIVDDLDRCQPEEIVDLIEGTKVLLEVPEIERKLQVLMLIDERVLRHAVLTKFEKLVESSADRDARANQLYAEHVEKLFACWFRLPSLSRDEVGQIVEEYSLVNLREKKKVHAKELQDAATDLNQLRELAGNTAQELQANLEVLPGTQKIVNVAAPEQVGSNRYADQIEAAEARLAELQAQQIRVQDRPVPEPRTKIENGELLYDADEAAQLKAAVEAYLSGAEQSLRTTTPRMLRTLLFKYQLGRILFMTLNGRVLNAKEREQLMAELLERGFSQQAHSVADRKDTGDRGSIPCIASQLS